MGSVGSGWVGEKTVHKNKTKKNPSETSTKKEEGNSWAPNDKQEKSVFFFFPTLKQGIRVKIQNSGKNWFFWFSLLGGEN